MTWEIEVVFWEGLVRHWIKPSRTSAEVDKASEKRRRIASESSEEVGVSISEIFLCEGEMTAPLYYSFEEDD